MGAASEETFVYPLDASPGGTEMALVPLVALIMFASSVAKLYFALNPLRPARRWALGAALPLEFFRFPRSFIFVISSTLIAYAGFALFRPIIHRYGTPPHERATAKKILSRYVRSSLDYFKLWPDKAYFFSASGKSFVAYCVGANFAVALADPIGPPEETVETIGQFRRFCEDNGWGVAFHQTLPDLLPIYRESGFKKLKIGDDAIVDLTNFTLDGKGFKKLRSRNNQLEKSGVRARFYDAPIPDDLIRRLKEVFDEWLRLPGRRERAFTLGKFDPDYLRSTPIATATERAVHLFMRRLPFLFSFGGLKAWKSKFAGDRERRYFICRHALDLPKVGVALGKVSELTE